MGRPLVKQNGWIPFPVERFSDTPSGGVRAWILPTLFFFQEIELAVFILDIAYIRINHLFIQKNDPMVKVIWKSLVRLCNDEPLICPFHIFQYLIDE